MKQSDSTTGGVDISADVVAYIDRRLATMERAPWSWGSPESLELQAMLLLEIRTYILRRLTYESNPFEARDVYTGFVRKHFPTDPQR